MKEIRNIIKIIYPLVFLLSLLIMPQLFYAQFPYFNSGQESNSFKVLGVGGKKAPGSSENHNVLFNSNGIMLVDNEAQFGVVSLENLNFSTKEGFILEFEFVLDQGKTYGTKYGDGIAMVLYDASIQDPNVGDKGGALGYAYTRTADGVKINGFSGGFMGLGLDLFGNYKNILASNEEIRNGITSSGDGDFIVLRGPYSPTAFEGYPVLFAISTMKNTNLYLDRFSGNSIEKQKGMIGQYFDLRGNKLEAKSGDPEYRRVIMSMIPGKDLSVATPEEGFFITIDIVNGVNTSTIVKNYFVPNTGSIKYKEQLSKTSSAYRDLAIQTPNSLKMAFTGSTGGASIRAHIRNIGLTLPFSPTVNDMVLNNILKNRQTVIKPLYGAFGYDTNVYTILSPPNKSILNLDKSSFRFRVLDSETNTFKNNVDPYNLTVANVGEFKYDVSTGEVIFIPVAGFTGDSCTFYYDIKNKKPASGIDISVEKYRSRTGAVTLNFTDKSTLFSNPYIIINRGVKNTKKE